MRGGRQNQKPKQMYRNRFHSEVEDKEETTLKNLVDKIYNYHKMISPNKTVEIETRVGNYKEKAFTAGIKQEEFYVVLNYLKHVPPGKCSHVITVNHIYQHENGNVRFYFNQDNLTKPIHVDYKKRVVVFPFEMADKDIGWRVSVATESNWSINDTFDHDPDFIRIKDRTTFETDIFKIDLTIVEQKKMCKSFEIEVELKSEIFKKTKNIGKIKQQLREYVQFIISIHKLIKKSRSNYFDDIISIDQSKVKYPVQLQLQKFVCDALPNCNVSRWFPGAMPINFGRASFDIIQQKQYFVSEKTDGVRHFLLVLESKAYLVTRKFDFCELHFPRLVEVFGLNGISLFDGEIVRNLETMRPVFMAFDIMIHDGLNVCLKPYGERIKILQQSIQRFNNNSTSYPFDVITKKFCSKTEIRDIFKLIKKDDDICSYVIHEDNIRHHRSDGIVFSPDVPYEPFANYGMFKWKYMTHWTIDFGIKSSGGNEFFYCSSGKNNIFIRQKEFSKEDEQNLNKDFGVFGKNDNVVVETSLNVLDGSWKYHIYRHDKAKPNYISVCIDTLETMACNISKEELIFRCVKDVSGDDWNQLLREEVQRQIEENDYLKQDKE
ncbi:mRNA capping enzyme [Entamoeba marina]